MSEEEALPQVCLYCSHLCGCPLLQGSSAYEPMTNAVLPGDHKQCDCWESIGSNIKVIRDRVYTRAGNGCIRGMAILPSIIEEAMKEKEAQQEQLANEAPDLASIIRQGMTSEEREYQLRYQTDDSGEVVLAADNQPLARPAQEIRAFAVSPNFHIQMSKHMVWFNTLDLVLKHIIESELEQGLITKSKRTPNKGVKREEKHNMPVIHTKPTVGRPATVKPVASRPVAMRPAATPVVRPTASPVAKPGPKPLVVRPGVTTATPAVQTVNRPKKSGVAPAASVPQKAMRRPTSLPAHPPVVEEEVVEQQQEEEEMSAAPEFNTDDLVQAVVDSMSPVVSDIVKTEMSRMFDAISIHHDVMLMMFKSVLEQVNGVLKGAKIKGSLSLEAFKDVFPKENKILSYLDDPQQVDGVEATGDGEEAVAEEAVEEGEE